MLQSRRQQCLRRPRIFTRRPERAIVYNSLFAEDVPIPQKTVETVGISSKIFTTVKHVKLDLLCVCVVGSVPSPLLSPPRYGGTGGGPRGGEQDRRVPRIEQLDGALARG